VPGHHRQRADDAVQPGPVPGDRPVLPGRRAGRVTALRQAQLPGDPRRPAAADAPPGVCRHARRAPGTGAPGRAAGRVRRDLGRGGPRPRPVAARPPPPPRPGAPAPAEVAAILELLRDARRPLIVAGYGVQTAEAAGELTAFAMAARIPVVTSPLGKGVGQLERALDLGATGRNGTYQANRAARSADVILAFGTRFDDRSTSSWLPGYTYAIPPARLIQVDIDPAELGRNYPVTLGVAANPKDVLGQLRDAMPMALDT